MAFHVRVRRAEKKGSFKYGYAFNRSEEWIAERILDPWRRGDEIVLSGVHFRPKEVQLSIEETDSEVSEGANGNSNWRELKAYGAVDRTNELLDRPAGETIGEAPTESFADDRRKVMVVVGRDKRLVDSLFNFLRTIDLQPQEWTKLVGSANSAAPYIGQVLDAAFSACQAVVVLITPDDVAYLRHDLTADPDAENKGIPQGQARPNVFYEAGMAMARFPTRTVFVEVGGTRAASDLGGIHAVRMNESAACRRDLAQRLSSAGCEVDESGTDWLSAGDFSEPTVAASASSEDEFATSSLVRRIDVFMAELEGHPYASEFKGALFNELVRESGVTGIPLAPQMSDGDYRMAERDMKMLLGQIKLKL
jgi:predicted nucleotide-binding protein